MNAAEALALTIDDIHHDHGLSVRAWCCLKNAECSFNGSRPIKTVKDLVSWTPKNILGLRNLGKRSLTDIEIVLARLGLSLVRPDSARCICGHRFDAHNDITKRCCFRVTVGLDFDGLPYPDPDEYPNPVSRICDLCPPSGFTTTGYDHPIYAGRAMWPETDWLRGYGDREDWTPVSDADKAKALA